MVKDGNGAEPSEHRRARERERERRKKTQNEKRERKTHKQKTNGERNTWLEARLLSHTVVNPSSRSYASKKLRCTTGDT